MRPSLRQNKKGLDTIIAEVLMLLIVIILSSIVFIWVVPAFQSSQVSGNSGAAYSEKFQTLWGQFATFANSIPESVNQYTTDQWSMDSTCPGGLISSPISGNVYVMPNAACTITASVGNVYVANGASLTVVGPNGQINGGLIGNYSASITLKNTKVTAWTGLSNVQAIVISGSSLDTSQTWINTDAPNSAIYEGGRGLFSMTNTTVYGMIESEVGHQTIFTNDTVTQRLEVESADFGQITNNKIGMLDLDQNGIMVISGNTIYGNVSSYPGSSVCAGGTATAVCYGCSSSHPCGSCSGNYCYGNRWCAAGNNQVVSGAHNEAFCIGTVEIDIQNTGSIPVNLVAAYMSNVALSGPVSWRLLSGGSTFNSLPVTIPVGQSANVTMQWTPPVGLGTLPWTDIYFVFVSSHGNYVDGHVYFGYNPALTVTSQSRPQNRVCPPCY